MPITAGNFLHPPYSDACVRAHTLTSTRYSTHTTQLKQKKYILGYYAVEADAAAARDTVAKVLGYPLNFKKPREITGQRSKGADQAVADAVKAANAFVIGTSTTFGVFWQVSHKKS